jgi:hypothetical protein
VGGEELKSTVCSKSHKSGNENITFWLIAGRIVDVRRKLAATRRNTIETTRVVDLPMSIALYASGISEELAFVGTLFVAHGTVMS